MTENRGKLIIFFFSVLFYSGLHKGGIQGRESDKEGIMRERERVLGREEKGFVLRIVRFGHCNFLDLLLNNKSQSAKIKMNSVYPMAWPTHYKI